MRDPGSAAANRVAVLLGSTIAGGFFLWRSLRDARAEALALELRLSDLYRGVLRATERQQHSLQDELAIREAYLDLERTRFRDRLQTRVEVEPGVDARQVQVPVDQQELLVDDSLDQLARRFDAAQLLRVHRSAIINLALLRELVHEGDRRHVAVLADRAGTRVPVSRERLSALRAALEID